MGKRIPDQVRGDAQHDGKQDSRETARSAELEVSELIAQSLLHSDGQQPYDRPLDGGVKHPQRENGSGQRESDDARELVAQASISVVPTTYGKSGAMLPTRKADQTRLSLRKGSAAAAWDTVKGIEWNRLYVVKYEGFRKAGQAPKTVAGAEPQPTVSV